MVSGSPCRSLVREFAAKGLRLTAQRRVLLEIIESKAPGHLDAAGLLKLAKERDAGIDRATVYRTLELLKKLGLIGELELMRRDHIYLACLSCGKVEEFDSSLFERLRQEIAFEQGFRIGVVRMEVGGRCSDCVKKAK